MRQLGALEAEVMNRLWDADRPLAVRDVLDDLARDRTIAYTTVMTVLDNLHTKGLVHREKHGRAYHYRASSSREEHTATLLRETLVGADDRGATLLHFVGGLPPEQVAELRAALDRHEDGGA